MPLLETPAQLHSADFNLKGGKTMKHAIRFVVAAMGLSLTIAAAVAQDQYTEGNVTRVTLVQILPGHFNAFMDDLKTNIKPIWDAQKQAGSSRITASFSTLRRQIRTTGISDLPSATRILRRSTALPRRFLTFA